MRIERYKAREKYDAASVVGDVRVAPLCKDKIRPLEVNLKMKSE